ncbi:phage portal protein [Sinorhizobium meliloti]|uniref:phage portal protein n=1 Tax=Rhizobium meliloti TaxID=382 RepID=UPI000FDCAB49|nr:phage portal protein [Sinorhizobium meliloti]RVK81397.1 phage portal protein [Sinorhizobium meliloti]RVQ78019.1 phage portal protein [Sinorhizobium meliloti]
MLKWFSKALTSMRHAPRPMVTSGLLRRTRFDYRREVGDCLDASVVTGPVQWIQRALPEARLTVMRYGRGGRVDEIADHGALSLIARPNEFYGDLALWSGTVLSYCIAGNAYWLKARNGLGRPGELWYVPHWTMKPCGPEDGSTLLSHYLYSPGSGIEPMKIDPADVVHFRHGLDPRDPRLGISPLDGAIREIFMDLESSNFVASLLRNMGVPGVVISPKAGGMVAADDVEATKAWFKQAFGGDRRGGPLVMGAPTDVSPYGFNPQQMNMSEARDVAEERVCASLGIPAAVVGFGAGLQSTKVGATMKEMAKLAWHNGVLPMGRVFADEIDRSIVPDFGPLPGRLKTVWDTSEVLALADDEDKETERWNKRVHGGWAMISEARAAAGLEVDDSHKIYLRPISIVEVPAGAPPRDGQDTQDPKQRGEKAQAPLQARRAGIAFLRLIAGQEEPRAKAFEKRLKAFFKELGKAARQAALPLLEEEDLTPAPGKAYGEKSDELLIARILDALGIGTHWTTFRQQFEAHYLEVAKEVSEAAQLAGISGSLPDPVARSVAAAGGRRAGLIDLSAQSKAALFDAIAEGRSEGDGAIQLAARIAGHVEAGPWATPEMRARVIARTETKFAQNISTIERGRAAGVERFLIFDGRLGPGRSLPSHIARNGGIVTAAEAMQMAAEEHPNGTLSFSPHFGDDQDEE